MIDSNVLVRLLGYLDKNVIFVFAVHCKNTNAMKLRILLAFVILAAAPVGLNAQTPEVVDLDLKYAADMLKVGTAVPDFTLKDVDGKTVSLSDFKGKKVVLQFWASWCPDCRAELPLIKSMQEQSDPSKIVFVAVSFDRTEEAFSSYVSKNGLEGVQLYDPAGMRDSAIAKAYNITWIPSLYLIDEKGKVMLATVVADKLAEAVADLK